MLFVLSVFCTNSRGVWLRLRVCAGGLFHKIFESRVVSQALPSRAQHWGGPLSIQVELGVEHCGGISGGCRGLHSHTAAF